MPRSTSSIQFGYLGVITVWPSMRVWPAILLTARHDVRVDLGAHRPLGQAEQAFLLEVIADEVGLVIENELAGKLASPVTRHFHIGGLSLGDIPDRAENLVHRQKSSRHAGAR